MDKQTLSNYGWIVICVLVLATLIALAGPFGSFIANSFTSIRDGLFDANENALNNVGISTIAPEVLDEGQCGDTLYWQLLSNGNLRIYGEGPMWDYQKYYTAAPWYKYRDEPYISEDGKTILNADGTDYGSVDSYNASNPNGWKYKKIIIEPGVTHIGDWAFYRACADKIVVPETVESIGIFCFRFSQQLETIVLPNSLKIIDDFAISRNATLTTVKVGNQVEKVGAAAFQWNPSLESVILPETCTQIGKQLSPKPDFIDADYNLVGVFENCTSLSTVSFGKADEIPQRVCLGTSVKNIIIPNTATSIGTYAFYNCSSLETVSFEKNSICESIESSAFSGCSSLKSITGGTALKTIGAYTSLAGLEVFEFSETNTTLIKNAFLGTSLTSIKLGENITVIPTACFNSIHTLKELYLPNSLQEIQASSLNHCDALEDIYYNGTLTEWKAVTKASGWSYKVNANCTIHFSDGTSCSLTESLK